MEVSCGAPIKFERWSRPATGKQIAALKSQGSYDGKYYSMGRASRAIGGSGRGSSASGRRTGDRVSGGTAYSPLAAPGRGPASLLTRVFGGADGLDALLQPALGPAAESWLAASDSGPTNLLSQLLGVPDNLDSLVRAAMDGAQEPQNASTVSGPSGVRALHDSIGRLQPCGTSDRGRGGSHPRSGVRGTAIPGMCGSLASRKPAPVRHLAIAPPGHRYLSVDRWWTPPNRCAFAGATPWRNSSWRRSSDGYVSRWMSGDGISSGWCSIRTSRLPRSSCSYRGSWTPTASSSSKASASTPRPFPNRFGWRARATKMP